MAHNLVGFAGDGSTITEAIGSLVIANREQLGVQFAIHRKDGSVQASTVYGRPRRLEATDEIDAFLAEVYSLSHANTLQDATDLIFEQFDSLLCDGSFGVCDEILKRLDVSRLETALMLSFLTITAAAKSKLPARSNVYAQVKHELTIQRSEKIADRLLRGLA